MFADLFDQQNDTGVLTSRERELMRQAYVAGLRRAADRCRQYPLTDVAAEPIEREAEMEER